MAVITETSDATNGTTTIYSMGTGDYFFGTLSSGTESDWVRVPVQAGQTYSFGLVGTGALNDSVEDTYLRLRNSSGIEIAADDDGGPGLGSNLTFTPTETGTYYLDAQSWSTSPGGTYGLSMTTGSIPSYDVVMGAGVLLGPDAAWTTTPGLGVSVSWGVRATGPAFDATGAPVPFEPLSAVQIAAAQSVFSLFDGVSGLTLTQVNPGGTTNSATILLGAYSSANDGAGAFAYYPGGTTPTDNAGDLWLNNNSVSQSSLQPGSFSYFALLHEMGHAVGLAHPGDYNAAPGTSITYDKHAQFLEDTHQYTVMSYFDESNTTTSVGSYPDTLLLYDIYALQQLYGADYSYHAGNTVYGFNATVDGAYDFTVNTTPLLSIWDGGGTDTLDLSGYSMAQSISLVEGTFSDVGGYDANLSIAYGSVIENAVAGGGDDRLIGNAAANRLEAGGGDDVALGSSGTDTLLGGAGNDTLRGGADADLLEGGAQEDLLTGDHGNDTLLGGAGFDRLEGGIGNDLLDGGNQADNLLGDAGNDTLLGSGGFDRLFGGDDDDKAYGGDSPDALFGQGGDDSLFGQADDDRLYGGVGNDFLDGGGQGDVLIGGAGFDSLLGSTGNDTLTGAFNADTFIFADFGGGFGQDTITDFDATNAFEKIDLSRVSAITSYADLTNPGNPHMTQVGADLVIDDFAGNTITLLGVSIGDMDQTDFIF